MSEKVAIRFNSVTYKYGEKKTILKEASFSVRENAKFTIMGQNGAGKSTMLKLITGEIKPEEGNIHIAPGATIAISKQVIPQDQLDLTVREYYASAFPADDPVYDLDKRIKKVLDAVNLTVPFDELMPRTVRALSGGQQARLLLSQALIQEPDILLLDEPTNNLDSEGIGHLIGFLLGYEKTVIVISHDASFLNTFTDGVLHLDVFTQTVQQYNGDYFTVVDEIAAQIEREQRKNAQLQKTIQDRKDKVNFFSNKGGKMRKLASKLRDEIEEAEDDIVNVRQEDKTIRPFVIPAQEMGNPIVHFTKVSIVSSGEAKEKDVDITVRRGDILHITGPNGIGKTTLLEKLAKGDNPAMKIKEGARVGYYRQDFSGLDFGTTPFKALEEVQVHGVNSTGSSKEDIFKAAAQFLLTGDILQNQIGSLSEGQKGLLSYARFLVQEPALLILDEPTNHINFRHLPIIAEALNKFDGAIVLVCHDDEFVSQLKITQTLDLSTLQ